jgi:hypothetical protein
MWVDPKSSGLPKSSKQASRDSFHGRERNFIDFLAGVLIGTPLTFKSPMKLIAACAVEQSLDGIMVLVALVAGQQIDSGQAVAAITHVALGLGHRQVL